MSNDLTLRPRSSAQQGESLPLLRARGIEKAFGATTALRGADIDVEAGSIHALVGENGAGKSTLGRIVAGAISPDKGSLELDGEPIGAFGSPAAALKRGISLVAQEIALAPDLTVAENISMGVESRVGGILRRRADAERAAGLIEEAGFDLNPQRVVGSLTIAQRQEVAILWALARRARLIVMDEPTAALARLEAAKLIRTVRRLRDQGLAIIYVSHHLDEVLELADGITVMRAGEDVGHLAAAETSERDMVELMLGRSQGGAYPSIPRRPKVTDPVLTVQPMNETKEPIGVQLSVAPGEIVGLFGLVGSGRSELMQAAMGARRKPATTISYRGRETSFRWPRQSLRAGIALMPESRRDEGLFLGRPIRENITASSMDQVVSRGVVRRRAERRVARAMAEDSAIHEADVEKLVGNLSGGNQQKVMFARCLISRPDVLILDEPARGVDVGAMKSIFESVVKLTEEGRAVIMISSDLEELMNMCHRIYVMREQEIVADMVRDFEEAPILAAAFGQTPVTSTGKEKA